MELDNLVKLMVTPQQQFSQQVQVHEWETGSLSVQQFHHDYNSKFTTEIEITDMTGADVTPHEKEMWGKTIFKGTLEELIAIVRSAANKTLEERTLNG